MTIELKINLSKIFGVGTIEGSAGTLQRYLSQTDNGGGEIRIDGQIKTLSEAETELSSHLSTDVSAISKIIATTTYSDQSLQDTFTLEIVLS
tara:strand:+ start:191 stop:466 length:276 start_codon:yes stop_codon:yes gene_type:complete